MPSQSPADGVARRPTFNLALRLAVFTLCCVADIVALRAIWARSDIAEGQFRRGYFEQFGDEVGLAMDSAVRPDTLPRFLLTKTGDLGVPPGMTVIVSLAPGGTYAVASDSTRAPYVVVGTEAPVPPVSPELKLLPGEARLVGARTLSLEGDRLALVAWDATRPWHDDAARLAGVRQRCAPDGAQLTIRVTEAAFDIRLGSCSMSEALASPTASMLFAVAAGPEWATVARRPGWSVEGWILWPAFALVALKETAMWFAFGLTAAAAVSTAIVCAALFAPVEAALTWALTMIFAVVATVVRIVAAILRKLPRRARVPAVLIAALGVWAILPGTPKYVHWIQRTHQNNGLPDACAVVGYSTVKGEALRRDRGGIRWFLDDVCPRCRGKTAALFASGETLAWVRNAFCASEPSFGSEQVIFLGGANDDFLSAVSSPSGALAMGRAFIEPGLEPWRHGYEAAAAASLARIDEQVSTLEELMRCVRARGARFLFLHDFMASDMDAGRQADRKAMLSRRRAAVESAGNTFVDLFEELGSEAGISWFNDPVHLSLIGHLRVTELACRQDR